LRANAKPAREGRRKRKQSLREHSTRPASARAKEQSIFKRGVALFNRRKFFEAHEAWEEIWLHAKLPEKTFLQGLIQVTAAFHHHSRGNLHGMESLLRRAIAKLDEFPVSHRGLRIGALRGSARAWLAALHSKDLARSPRLPVLKPQN
jgi:predicted metal-dependent hydrolase